MENQNNFEFCPICECNTLKYDKEIGGNRCYNEYCGWVEKVLPAASIEIVKYAIKHSSNEPHRKFLEKILQVTINAQEEGKKRMRSFNILDVVDNI